MKALINIIIGNIQSRQHSVRASKTEFRAGAMEDKVGKCTSNTWECHFYKTNTWECQFCKTNTPGNSFHTVTGTNIQKLQLLDTFYKPIIYILYTPRNNGHLLCHFLGNTEN